MSISVPFENFLSMEFPILNSKFNIGLRVFYPEEIADFSIYLKSK